MAIQYKFVNLNKFPVSVSAQRGGMVVFRPGESSSDLWFSRFVGHQKLTKVAVDPGVQKAQSPRPKLQPRHPLPASVPSLPESPQPKPMLVQIESEANEETLFYTRTDGIYRCKKCEIFRSGSRASMLLHLTEYHKLDLKDGEEKTPLLPSQSTPVSVQASREPVTDAVEAEQIRESIRDEELATPPTATVFVCSYCGRKYKTENGLSNHVAKVHG